LHFEILSGTLIDRKKPLRELLDALSEHEVKGEIIRAVDYNIKPGVSSDEGEGDDWPEKRSPKAVADWTPMLASNAAHLASLLSKSRYPGKA
jgi:hypothetical protein